MNYDPECRKATRRKINVALPCIVIRDNRARVPSEKAWPAPRLTVGGKRSDGHGVVAFKGR